MDYHFPLESSGCDLTGYAGPVDVWDIDKTYLLTEFERLRDLLSRAFEGAIEKETRPGAAPLLVGLRGESPGEAAPGEDAQDGAAPSEANESEPAPRTTAPLFFISASPPQMRAVIEQKMQLDGVRFDGVCFKDYMGLLKRGRIREVKRHTAYKLTALLLYRVMWPQGAREWLVGDDAEFDAAIYSMYAQIRAGELLGKALERELRSYRVRSEDREAIARLAERAAEASPAPAGGSVEAIYIFAEAARPKLDLATLPRVIPVRDALDLAERMAARGRIGARTVAAVRREIAEAAVRPSEA